MSFDLISRLLFPTPPPSYGVESFPEELIWVPKSLDPRDAHPEDCVPCLLLPYASARFLVFYLHSNAEDIGRCHAFCTSVRSQFQVHVLAVEYPGYGVCPGGPCDEHKATENAFTAFRFVHEVLNWPLDSIIILGRSIGCGPAISIAVRYQVAGVIVISPMLSVREICWDVLGPLSYAFVERFPNKDRVPLMGSPFLVVHGQKDTIIPCRHGIELYKVCRSRKLLVCPQDMEHNTNLLADISYLVLPMLQFFSLPDYCFEEMKVPSWVYDKRMCPYYSEPAPSRLSSPVSPHMNGLPAKPNALAPIEEAPASMDRESTVYEPSQGCWNLQQRQRPQGSPSKGDDLEFGGAGRLIASLVEPFFGHRRSEAGGVSRSAPASPMVGSRTLGPVQAGPLFQSSSNGTGMQNVGPSVVLPRPSPPNCETGDQERAPELSKMDMEKLKKIGKSTQKKVGEPSLLQRSAGAPPVMQYRTASQNRFQAPQTRDAFHHPVSSGSRKPLASGFGPSENRPPINMGPVIGGSPTPASASAFSQASEKNARRIPASPRLPGERLELSHPSRAFGSELEGGEKNMYLSPSELQGIVQDLEKHFSDEPPAFTPRLPGSGAGSSSTVNPTRGAFLNRSPGVPAQRTVVGPDDASVPIAPKFSADSIGAPPPLPDLSSNSSFARAGSRGEEQFGASGRGSVGNGFNGKPPAVVDEDTDGHLDPAALEDPASSEAPPAIPSATLLMQPQRQPSQPVLFRGQHTLSQHTLQQAAQQTVQQTPQQTSRMAHPQMLQPQIVSQQHALPPKSLQQPSLQQARQEAFGNQFQPPAVHHAHLQPHWAVPARTSTSSTHSSGPIVHPPPQAAAQGGGGLCEVSPSMPNPSTSTPRLAPSVAQRAIVTPVVATPQTLTIVTPTASTSNIHRTTIVSAPRQSPTGTVIIGGPTGCGGPMPGRINNGGFGVSPVGPRAVSPRVCAVTTRENTTDADAAPGNHGGTAIVEDR